MNREVEIMNEKGGVLFLPLLGILNDNPPENKLEFIKEVIRKDQVKYSEEQISEVAENILNIHLGIEPMPARLPWS